MVDRAKHNIMDHLDLEEDSTDNEGVESIADQASSTLDNSSLYEDDEDLPPRDPVLPAGPGQGLPAVDDQGLLAGPDQGLLDAVQLAGADQGRRGRHGYVSLLTFL
jgi:hypothetical protein